MKKAVADQAPFYLYMSHYAVHTPIEDDKRFSDNYRGKYDAQLQAALGEKEAKYAALVEGMDKSLGDILDYLQTTPRLAETLSCLCRTMEDWHWTTAGKEFQTEIPIIRPEAVKGRLSWAESESR